MKWKKRWPPAHNRAATIQLRWISFHSTPFRFIHSLQLIVCCASSIAAGAVADGRPLLLLRCLLICFISLSFHSTKEEEQLKEEEWNCALPLLSARNETAQLKWAARLFLWLVACCSAAYNPPKVKPASPLLLRSFILLGGPPPQQFNFSINSPILKERVEWKSWVGCWAALIN